MTEKQTEYELARKLLNEEKQERAEMCQAEIERVLERYKCVMTGLPEFVPTPNGYTISVIIRVSALDD